MAWNGSNSGEAESLPLHGGKSTSDVKRKGFRFPVRGAVAGAIVVLLGGLVLLYFGRARTASAPQETKKVAPSRIAEAKPAPAPKAAEEKPKGQTRAEKLFAKTNGYVKAAGKMLTDDGRVLTFPPPKEGEFRIVHSHGKKYQCDSQGNFVDITPKPLFDNPFENALAGMVSESGIFLPFMLQGHSKEEVAAMLIKKVEISPDDPPDVVEKKEAVAALKKDMMNYIKEGGTFDEYVSEMKNQTAKERSLKASGLKEIAKMIREGDVEGAAMFRQKFDAMVEKQGMRPIKLPKAINEALGGVKKEN